MRVDELPETWRTRAKAFGGDVGAIMRDCARELEEAVALVDVVAAVRQNAEGRYWLCKRDRNGAHAGLAGMWEYPGGKVEPGELLKDALRRELVEEFGDTNPVIGEVLDSITYQQYRVTLFAVSMDEPVVLNCHSETRWMTPREACSVEHLPLQDVIRRLLHADDHAKVWPDNTQVGIHASMHEHLNAADWDRNRPTFGELRAAVDRVPLSAGPALPEDIKKLRLDAENVLTWEASKDGDPLTFAHLRRFAKAVLQLTAALASTPEPRERKSEDRKLALLHAATLTHDLAMRIYRTPNFHYAILRLESELRWLAEQPIDAKTPSWITEGRVSPSSYPEPAALSPAPLGSPELMLPKEAMEELDAAASLGGHMWVQVRRRFLACALHDLRALSPAHPEQEKDRASSPQAVGSQPATDTGQHKAGVVTEGRRVPASVTSQNAAALPASPLGERARDDHDLLTAVLNEWKLYGAVSDATFAHVIAIREFNDPATLPAPASGERPAALEEKE